MCVRPTSQNSYPIHGQNLRFLICYPSYIFMTRRKISIPWYLWPLRMAHAVALSISYEGLFNQQNKSSKVQATSSIFRSWIGDIAIYLIVSKIVRVYIWGFTWASFVIWKGENSGSPSYFAVLEFCLMAPCRYCPVQYIIHVHSSIKWYSSAYTLKDCKTSGNFLWGSIYVWAPIERFANVNSKRFIFGYPV